MRLIPLNICIVLIWLLAGCATYSVEKVADDDTILRAKIRSFFHDVKALDATYTTSDNAKLTIKVGMLGVSDEVSQSMCVLFPHLCQ